MKIMVCYDGSGDNTAVLAKARERAQASEAVIHLVSVLIGSSAGTLDALEPAKKELEDSKASFQADRITCESKVMFGESAAGESIVEYAIENEIDEIVIGIQRKSKVGKLIFGSTAQHVILEAPCPVLTVK